MKRSNSANKMLSRTGGRTNLGAMLRLHRMVKGMTLRQLAPHIGVSAATIMRIEAGYKTDAATLLKLLAWMFQSADSEECE